MSKEPGIPPLPAELMTPMSPRRVSKLGVLAFILALLPVIILGVAMLVVITLVGVPILGLLVAILALAPLAMLALLLQSVTWGMAGAAIRRCRASNLRGIAFAYMARSIAGVQILTSLLQVIALGMLPSLLFYSESVAWRSLSTRAVVCMEKGVNESAEWRQTLNNLQNFDAWEWTKAVAVRSYDSFLHDTKGGHSSSANQNP